MITIFKQKYKLQNPDKLISKIKKETDYNSKNIFFSDIYKDYYGKISQNSFSITCKRLKYIGFPQYHLVKGKIDDQTLHIKAGIHNIVFTAYVIFFIFIILFFTNSTGEMDLKTMIYLLAFYSIVIVIRLFIMREMILHTMSTFDISS